MTTIEWTHPPGFRGESWNPVTGCTKVSQGCKHCYAERVFPRAYASSGRKFTNVATHHDRLDWPLRARAPRCYFVNSMSDLFHEAVPDEFIDRVFAVMALATQHRFIVLTKRPQRMLKYLGHGPGRSSGVANAAEESNDCIESRISEIVGRGNGPSRHPLLPLPNVWLGVSCEDQATADERIPLLLQTPAAVRLVSLEPLLGPVNLRRYLDDSDGRYCTMGGRARRAGDRFRGEDLESRSPSRRAMGDTDHSVRTPPRGEPDCERLPADSGDEGRRAGQRAGTSSGLCEPAWPNPGRADGEPHQRREARQPASEYGTRNSVRAGHPRARGAGEDESERCEEQCGEADSGTGGGDTVETPERRSIEGNRHGLRNQRPDGVEDCAPASLAWVICGGESGPGARPCNVEWIRDIVRQGSEAQVACFVKQGGRHNRCAHDQKGGCWMCMPTEIKVREYPDAT